MNSEEGMSMAKMAVTVLLVVLVIGAVIAIVYAAYNWFNSGKDKLAGRVNSINDTTLSAWDNKDVTGSEVLACLKDYKGSDFAVCISNLDNLKAGKATNYCARITGASPDLATTATGTIKLESAGDHYTANPLEIDAKTGQYFRMEDYSKTTRNGATEFFIKQAAKWHAYLIYDNVNNEVIGMYFTQMGD